MEDPEPAFTKFWEQNKTHFWESIDPLQPLRGAEAIAKAAFAAGWEGGWQDCWADHKAANRA